MNRTLPRRSGVAAALAILQRELDLAMALCGRLERPLTPLGVLQPVRGVAEQAAEQQQRKDPRGPPQRGQVDAVELCPGRDQPDGEHAREDPRRPPERQGQ